MPSDGECDAAKPCCRPGRRRATEYSASWSAGKYPPANRQWAKRAVGYRSEGRCNRCDGTRLINVPHRSAPVRGVGVKTTVYANESIRSSANYRTRHFGFLRSAEITRSAFTPKPPRRAPVRQPTNACLDDRMNRVPIAAMSRSTDIVGTRGPPSRLPDSPIVAGQSRRAPT